MCDLSMGADMQAWAARQFRADSEIVTMRQNGLRNGEPSRLAHTEFIARTRAATVVADERAVIKITTPPTGAAAARVVFEMVNREVQIGAALCEQAEPDVVGITTMWTVPAILPATMKVSPLRSRDGYNIAVQNDYTQLLPPDVAAQTRLDVLYAKYLDKLHAAQSRDPTATRDSLAVSPFYKLYRRARRGQIDEAYIEYLTPRVPEPFLLATEQPRVDGIMLRNVLLDGAWPRMRPALRATIAALERLQRTRHLQHGDFSPANVIITPAGDAVLIDLARAWMAGATLATRGVKLPTQRAARGFDLRFFGVWLAEICAEQFVAGREPPAELRVVAAALVVPTRAMVDEARLARIWYPANLYEFHGPRHASFAEYVHALLSLTAWLLAGDGRDTATQLRAAHDLLFDVGPWATAAAACMQWRLLDDEADLCVPTNALLFDVLAE